MKKRLKAFIGAMCATVVLITSTAAHSAPASASAGVLIDIATNAPVNGQTIFGPINVSKYSEFSILAYVPDVALGSTDVGTVVIFSPTATPIEYTGNLDLDLKGAGAIGGTCYFSRAGTSHCVGVNPGATPPVIPVDMPVRAPYVSFIVVAPGTVSLKLWAQP